MSLLQKRLILLVAILVGIGAIWYFDLMQYLNLDWIHAHRTYLVYMVNNHYWYSVFVYMCFYILITALAVPGAVVITLVGGYLFNVFPGVLFINIAATLGATLAFLAARYLVGVWVQRKYQTQLRAINQEIKDHGNYYFLIARLMVIFPFFLVNLVGGLTRVPVSTFMWTTSLGILPASIVFAYVGRQLMSINSLEDVFMWPVMLALVLLGLLLFMPFILRGRKKW